MEKKVTCPVCKGTKLNPYGANAVDPTCKCCKGAGTITEDHLRILGEISKDLRKKLEEKQLARNDRF